jgi:putative ABC transport system permease protein
VSQIFESIGLALQAIWANKLRSLLTVLGNIVAVSSIVVVVSLIQGMNAYVSTTIVSGVGADSFTIRRVPPIRTDEEDERARSNPLLTLDEAGAIRAYSSQIVAVMAQSSASARVSYKTQELDNVRVQGVTSEYLNFDTFSAERGRMISTTEVDRSQPVTIIGWDIADKLFGQANPLDKVIKIAGLPFRIVGVSEKKGSFFGNSQDSFAVIPYGAHLKLFGPRQSLELIVKPRTPDVLPAAMDEATVALRVARHLKPREPDNFGMFTSDTLLGIYHQATNGIFAVLVGGGRALARGRRHRDHEHHADGPSPSARARSACARRSVPSGATSCRRS